MKVHPQRTPYSSPWGLGVHFKRLLFRIAWGAFCRHSPKKLYRLRNVVLRLFGCQMTGAPFVDATARIHFPWNLRLADRSCISARVDVYSLDVISIGERAIVAQDVFLCCGTHDFASPKRELMTAPIHIGHDAFIGARAIVLPGVSIGEGSVVGAGSVVARNADAWGVYAGNPARRVGQRVPAIHP